MRVEPQNNQDHFFPHTIYQAEREEIGYVGYYCDLCGREIRFGRGKLVTAFYYSASSRRHKQYIKYRICGDCAEEDIRSETG